MVHSICGSYKITYHPDGGEGDADGEQVVIDFTPPFKRLYMYPALEEALRVKLPDPTTLHSPQSTKILSDICDKHNVECSPPRTAARLLDKVRARFFSSVCRSFGRSLHHSRGSTVVVYSWSASFWK